MNDKRKDGRLQVEVKVDYRTVGSFITDYSANLSRTGIFIKTSLPVEVGEKIRVRLTLPDGEAPFALDAVVRWIAGVNRDSEQPAGMGVEFVGLDPETEAKLESLFDSHTT